MNGIAQVLPLQQALKSSESLLEASKLGHEVGVRTNLDVLNAQLQAYAARRDLYQAEYNYLLSQLRPKAAVGGLVEEDAGTPCSSVTPEERHNMIATAAYYRAECRGFAEGCASEDWLAAEAEIDQTLKQD